MEGRVVRTTGKEVWVDAGGERISCLLRGRFRREDTQVVAGDCVRVAKARGGAVIESIEPRRSWLSRYPGGRGAAPRVIVANLDVLFLVESLRAPDLSYRFADRVLVSAESGHVDVHICLNKIDLAEDRTEATEFLTTYKALGYNVTLTSARTGDGTADVASLLGGGIYAFAGRSGVGKSSLLNRIAPGLDLAVRDVAARTGRGRHTTTYSQLFKIAGGYVADTPGMQTFGFPGDDEGELAGCFREFGAVEEDCRFQPCTHSHEPDCAVKAAVEEGRIARSRHESYLDMLGEIRARKKTRYS